MKALTEFLFILAVPLVVVAGAVVGLFAVGALFDLLDNPEEMRRRVEGLFRRAPRPPKTAGPDHYYRPYWTK